MAQWILNRDLVDHNHGLFNHSQLHTHLIVTDTDYEAIMKPLHQTGAQYSAVE